MASYKVSASRDLPLNEDASWDGAAAKESLFNAAGWPDHPDPAKAAQGFLCWDSSAGTLKGSYHLPFARVEGGKMEALASGLRAAAARLPQTDIPDRVKADARAVLDHYFDKISPDKDEPDADDKGRALVFAVPAPITRLYTSADQPAGSVSEPWVAAAKKMALDPSVFETNPPHYFRAHISNQKTDAYYTRMHESTLQNFADDATNGVSFQNSHRETELGFGRSIRGEYMGSASNGTARTEADFYTVPGLNLNGVSTSDLIMGMRCGLVRDVSVGFYGGSMRCATCKRLLFTGDCWHVPGLRYDRDGQPSDNPDAPPSVAWVHDARLAEVSAVYDGACPGAAIMKARSLSAAGHLRPDAARLLEARYRIRLPESRHTWSGFDPAPEKETRMPEFTLDDVRRDLRRALDLNDPTIDPVAHVLEIAPRLRDMTALQNNYDALQAVKAENERLVPLADLGKQYHADLLEETLSEGVRAQGNLYPLETQRALLAGATLEQLKTLKTSYAEQAKATLAGGRVSADRGEHDPAEAAPANGKSWTPKGAFAG